MKKKKLKILIAVMLVGVVAAAGFLIATRGDDGVQEVNEEPIAAEEGEPIIVNDEDDIAQYENGISFEEEEEGAEITLREADKSEFYGSWHATSGSAAYYYGKIEITVREDGTWEGNITDEPLSGTWETKDKGIYLTSDIFNCTLNFSDTGHLLLHEVYEEDDYDSGIVVLSKM